MLYSVLISPDGSFHESSGHLSLYQESGNYENSEIQFYWLSFTHLAKPYKAITTLGVGEQTSSCRLNVHPTPHSHVEILTPYGEYVFGGGTFGRCLGLEGRTLINGISALLKRPQRAFTPSLFLPGRDSEKTAIQEPRSGSSPDTESIRHLYFGLPEINVYFVQATQSMVFVAKLPTN